jgi:DNA-binding NtrC family response regulator
MDYSWPGNIRELENTLHNAVLLSKEEEISPPSCAWRRSTTPRRRRAIMNWTTLFATSWRFPASRCGSG